MKPQKVTRKALQSECDRFNRFAAIGSEVAMDPGPLFGTTQTVTIAPPGAFVSDTTAGSQALVSVSNGLGHVPLSSIRFGKAAS